MSVKLLWKALGSNHRMFVVQWRMQLSLSGLLPWMIGPTDHTQKHIGNFVRVLLVASESTTVVTKEQIKSPFYLGRGKSFNYIWPIAIGSSQSAYHNYVTSSSSYQVLSTRSPRIRIYQRKRNIAIDYQEQYYHRTTSTKEKSKKEVKRRRNHSEIRYLVF